MVSPATNLVFRWFGIDDGAGAQFDRMAGKAETTSRAVKAFGLGVGVAAAAVAVESVKMAAQFQSSTELMHTQAGVAQDAVDQLRQGILNMAGSVGTAPEALSEALYHIVSTGQRGAGALHELQIAAEGAQVGGADLTDVTNALNATIVSGIRGAQNFSSAMGSLNSVVGAGDMHMQDLAEALGSGVLAVVKQFNVTLPQAGAALATFGDNNIRGAQAATYLRMTVQSLSKPSVDADAALSQIGLTAQGLQTSLAQHGLTGALQMLHDHFVSSGMKASEWGSLLEDAFTKKAGTGLALLVGQFGRYQTKQQEVTQGARSFGADWSATTQTLGFQWHRLVADVDVLLIRLGGGLIPVALDVIRAFEETGRIVEGAGHVFMDVEPEVLTLAAAIGGPLVLSMGVAAVAALGDMIVEAGGLSGILATLAGKAINAGAAILGFAAADGTAGAALSLVNPVTAAVAIGIGALTYSWMQNRKANEAAKKAVDSYVASLHTNDTSLQSLQQAVTSITAKYQPLLNLHRALEVQGDHLSAGVISRSAAYKEWQSQLQSATGAERTAEGNVASLGREYGLTATQVQALAKANNIDLTQGLQAVDAQFGPVIAAAQLSHHPISQAAADFQDMASKATTLGQAVQDLSGAWDQYLGHFLGLKQAQLTFNQDLRTMQADLKKSGGSIRDTGGAATQARGDFLSLVGQVENVTTATYQNAKQQHAAIAAAKGMRDQIRGLGIDTPVAQNALSKLTAFIKSYKDTTHAAAAGIGQSTDSGFVAGLVQDAQSVETTIGGVVKNMLAAAKHAAGVKSPSTETAYIAHMMAAGLIIGFRGEAATIKNALTSPLQNALTQMTQMMQAELAKQQGIVKASRQQLRTDLQQRRQDIASLATSMRSGVDFGGLFGTDPVTGKQTVGNANKMLGTEGRQLHQEAGILKKLRAHHLREGLIEQIAGLPPDQAITIGEEYLSGQLSIHQANQDWREIVRSSRAAATTVTDPRYAHQLARDHADMHDQTHTLHEIRDLLKHERRQAGRDIAHYVVYDPKTKKWTVKDAKGLLKELRKLARQSGHQVKIA